jgi:hypothetical protein
MGRPPAQISGAHEQIAYAERSGSHDPLGGSEAGAGQFHQPGLGHGNGGHPPLFLRIAAIPPSTGRPGEHADRSLSARMEWTVAGRQHQRRPAIPRYSRRRALSIGIDDWLQQLAHDVFRSNVEMADHFEIVVNSVVREQLWGVFDTCYELKVSAGQSTGGGWLIRAVLLLVRLSAY